MDDWMTMFGIDPTKVGAPADATRTKKPQPQKPVPLPTLPPQPVRTIGPLNPDARPLSHADSLMLPQEDRSTGIARGFNETVKNAPAMAYLPFLSSLHAATKGNTGEAVTNLALDALPAEHLAAPLLGKAGAAALAMLPAGLPEKWAVLTAENPLGKTAAKEANDAATAKLKSLLEDAQIAHERAFGGYIDHQNGNALSGENGFLLHNVEPYQAQELGKRFNQNSVLTHRGLETVNGGRYLEPVQQFRPTTPEDQYFTEVGGHRFSADIDFGNQKPLETSTPQVDIVRPAGQRTKQEKKDLARELTYNALNTPRARQLLDKGLGIPNSLIWYDTREIRRRAAEALGSEEAGNAAVDELMNHMAASTAKSDPRTNLKRASMWRQMQMLDKITSTRLRKTHLPAVSVPEGFGHMAQRGAHQPGVADVLDYGGVLPIRSPKGASFGGRSPLALGNLGMNWKPLTNDTWNARMLLDLEPRLAPFMDITPAEVEGGLQGVTPRPQYYRAMEQATQQHAAELHAKGLLDIPEGYAPTAPVQSAYWHAINPAASNPSTTISQIFDDLLSSSASLWGVSPSKANELIWNGHAPLEGKIRRGVSRK